MLQGRSADGEIWRRSATELGEVGVGVALRASWSTARLGVTLWMHCRGQGELKNTDGVELRWQRCLPAAALQAEIRRYAGGARAGSDWETPRWLCGSSARLEEGSGAAER